MYACRSGSRQSPPATARVALQASSGVRPGGEYHLAAYSQKGGGGLHACDPREGPASIPYVHVADARAAFRKAIRAGAEAAVRPERVMEGVTVALVRAPGGVMIGFSGP